jgi:3-isopropylmalate/(R)-2-methylmalate dehydratase small subunit
MYTGKVHFFGNDIDTDQIIPSQYLVLPSLEEMVKHAMEPIKKDFYKEFEKGDVIVGGRNFGCGSSREQAPGVLKVMGVSVIIAQSFARIFYRNCINLGVPVIELSEAGSIDEGDVVSVDFERGIITNKTNGREYCFPKYSKFVQTLVDAGGLIEYYKKNILAKGE